MTALSIRESDIEEKFVRSSGRGGQKVNKSSTCVMLHHTPSGLRVKCQTTRLQGENRYHARSILCEKLEQKIHGKKSARERERHRIRARKRRRSKRAKEKMIQDKKRQSRKKELRKPPPHDR